MALFSKILIVEDDENTRKGLGTFLEGLDFDLVFAADGKEGWEQFLKERPDLVLADIRMPELNGISLLERIRGENSRVPVILLTAYGSVEDAVKAMKKGAFYYLTKPVNLEELEFLVKKAIASLSLFEENEELKEALFRERYEEGEIVAVSPRMKEVLDTVSQIAQSQSTVLIEGESGSGKELIAHRIHRESSRASKPFVAVHCAALTETLLASELFGHEKGSFTGATERRVGRFERAHKGTLFLDEIGEISQETQVKLLRVLQEGEFERVGGTRTIRTDVRLLCATNRNLLDEVRAGRFREDLYYRINVIYLRVPSLRERREDIPVLFDHFIRKISRANGKKIESIDNAVRASLHDYAWPGNIRELKNIVERMVVLNRTGRLTMDQVPEDIRGSLSLPVSSGEAVDVMPGGRLDAMEKVYIEQALRDTRGNKSLAARKLGISRRTLYRKMEEYKIS